MESYIHRCVKKVGRLTAVGHHPFQVPHSGAKTGWRKKEPWQASLNRLPEILLGHQGKSHLSLIFLSRVNNSTGGSVSSPGAPWRHIAYLSVPHLYPALSGLGKVSAIWAEDSAREAHSQA